VKFYQNISQSVIELEQFVPLVTIGRGRFGKVMISQKDGCLFAVKEIALTSSRALTNCQNERVILQMMGMSTFVIGLDFALHQGNYVYFAMEFCPGGDLLTALEQNILTVGGALFYSTEVLLGLKILHEKNVIYRDLKPENILLDSEGHIKIADFGLAKVLEPNAMTFTVCGTKLYLAPEMLHGKGYGISVDFWQYGCFIFELYTGTSPFCIQNLSEPEAHSKIMQGNLQFPLSLTSNTTKNIISRLLQVSVNKRLGCQADESWETVQQHPFFRSINWQEAVERELSPPFTTVFPGSNVLHNFSTNFVDEKAEYQSERGASKQFSHELFGFDFNSEWSESIVDEAPSPFS